MSRPSKLMFVLLGALLLAMPGCGSKEEPSVSEPPPQEAPPSEATPAVRRATSTTSVLHSGENTLNKIAAVVNGEMVSLFELRGRTMAELSRRRIPLDDPRVLTIQNDLLDAMINEILVRQEAKRFKVTVSDAEVEAESEKVRSRSGLSPEQFEAQLKREGLTLALYKERLGNNMLRQRMAGFMVTRKVFITPDEVTAYYEKNKDKFVQPRSVDFSIMILPEKLNGPAIYKQLQNGELKFENVAKEHSMDASKNDGGKVAGVPWDRLPPEMQKLLGPLKDGQYAPLMRTRGGFAILRRDAMHEARQLNFEEAKPRVEEILLAPLLEERFNEWITQLRSKAVIDIRI